MWAELSKVCGERRTEVTAIFVGGRHVAVLKDGAGSEVLFLHGYMSCKESFYYNIKAFSSYFSVTAPDFPGFGASAPLPAAWSVGDYSLWLKEFIAACGLVRPHIVAHSFGARVALRLACEYPGLVGDMVITGGAGIVKPRTRTYKRRVAAYRIAKKIAPRFAESHFGSKEYRELSPLMRESYKKIVNEDLRGCAKNVRARTLLIYGENDEVTPPFEEGEIFRSCIAGSRLEVIPGGHFCFCENYKLFNEIALAFLINGGTEL